MAGDILAAKYTTDAGEVARAALAVGDGREDVGLDRLRKLLDSSNDIGAALGGAGRSSDIGCQGQGRSDIGRSRGRQRLDRVARRSRSRVDWRGNH